MIRKFDFLVIGSGVAGMSYALQVAPPASGKGTVGLVCKTSIEEANTSKAQGGVASVTNRIVDNLRSIFTIRWWPATISVIRKRAAGD